MAMTTRRKVCIGIAVVLLLIFIVTPLILGAALRGKVEDQIAETTKARVKLGGLSIKFLPPGAVLSDLEVGETVAEADGAPLAKIGTLKASVSWGTVFGGATHVTSLKLYDPDIVLACDETGTSNLQKFLDTMGPSDRKDPLPIYSLVMKNAKITCYTHQKVIAPKSDTELEPTTVEIGYLSVDDIVLPPPGKEPAGGQWMDIALERLKIAAPLRGVESPASPAEAGAAMAEGLQIDELQLSLAQRTASEVMKIRDARIDGLRLRNVMHSPKTPETLSRITWSLKLCSGAASEVKRKREVVAEKREKLASENGGIAIEDLQVRNSAIEIDGPDAHGNLAFYRLSQLDVDIQDFAWGDGAAVPEGKKGLMRLASPSKSTAGDGQVLIEMKDVEGQWPKLSFDMKKDVTTFPLAPLSTRVEQRTGAGVQGSMASVFAGPTRNGEITWDGSITLSKDTKLVGKSTKGKIMSGLGSLTSSMSGLATGKPIEGFGVRGTLASPTFKRPSVVSKAVMELATQMVSGDSVSLPGVLLKGSGDVLNKGVGEGKELLKKVPGVGGLFESK